MFNFHVPIILLITKHSFDEHPTFKIKWSESENGHEMQQQITLMMMREGSLET